MLDKSFGLFFYLKKPKNYLKGPLPIYLRITVDGCRAEISVKRSCEPLRWNAHAGRASGSKEETKALNNYLNTYQLKVFEVKRTIIEKNKLITSKEIKNLLSGINVRDKMIVKIFSDYNDNVKKLIGIDYSKFTWRKYDRIRRTTEEFILWKYNTKDINIRQLNFEFVTQLEIWYKTIKKCSHNTTMKYISIFKMIVIFCLDNQWLDYDPFARFEMKQHEVFPTFLTADEIQRIASKELPIERLALVRDVYLFCCFTGLSYADVAKLKRSEISVGIDNQLWIFTDRLKTGTKSRIPLLPISLKIMKRYETNPFCINTDRVLPVLSNQKYNSYLKEISIICGINKNLTTHTARHTFGTTVTLSNGVPIESVSKMLGHKKIATTQHYARVLDIKVSEDMQHLRNRLNNEN